MCIPTGNLDKLVSTRLKLSLAMALSKQNKAAEAEKVARGVWNERFNANEGACARAPSHLSFHTLT